MHEMNGGHESLGQSSIELIITLIHGTFASGAAWTLEGSDFSLALRKFLNEITNSKDHQSTLLIQRFKWSGKNSHDDRTWAGKELVFYLHKAFHRHPCAKHILIGHSHGGNVACYAMRDSKVASRVAGIACLGTPFIHCKPRKAGPLSLPSYVDWSPFYLVAVAMFALWLGPLPSSYPSWLIYLVVASMLYFFPGLSNPISVVLREYPGGAKEIQEEILEFIELPTITKPILCLESHIQEARLWLRFCHLICNLPIFLWFPAMAVIFVGWFFYFFDYMPYNILIALVTGTAFSWLTIILNAAATILLKGRGYSFGGESMKDNIYTDIYVDLVPPVADLANYRLCEVQRDGRWFVLEHSLLCESKDAIQQMAVWITRTLYE